MKFSCHQKRLHHDLSGAPLCFLDKTRFKRGWCDKGHVGLHIQDTFFFYGKDARSLLQRPFGAGTIRQCVRQEEDVSACDMASHCCFWLRPQSTLLHPSLLYAAAFQLLTNHMLTSGVSASRAAERRAQKYVQLEFVSPQTGMVTHTSSRQDACTSKG